MVKGFASCASMAAFDRVTEIVTILKELQGITSKPLPEPILP